MPFIITRDGRPVNSTRYHTEFAILHEMHNRSSQSLDWACKYEGYAVIEVPADLWHPAEQREQQATARHLFTDHGHDGYNDDETRSSCGACALGGYGENTDDGDQPLGPNYGGWARIYVQAGEPIPARWVDAFLAEVRCDNDAYTDCLRRDINTYGVLGGAIQHAITTI